MRQKTGKMQSRKGDTRERQAPRGLTPHRVNPMQDLSVDPAGMRKDKEILEADAGDERGPLDGEH